MFSISFLKFPLVCECCIMFPLDLFFYTFIIVILNILKFIAFVFSLSLTLMIVLSFLMTLTISPTGNLRWRRPPWASWREGECGRVPCTPALSRGQWRQLPLHGAGPLPSPLPILLAQPALSLGSPWASGPQRISWPQRTSGKLPSDLPWL